MFGVLMTDTERAIFFKTLDVTGNGMLSWGELTVDYVKTGQPAFLYYVNRWRQMRDRGLGFGAGLQRIEGVDYEQYRYDYVQSLYGYQGTYGPQGKLKTS